MRVLLLHNFLTPYRVPLFAEVAQRMDLEVWILGDVAAIREWEHKTDRLSFPCRLLPNLSLPTGSRDYRVLINPTLPWELARHRCDAVIANGWDTFATLYAAFASRARRRPFVLWSGSTAGEGSWRRTATRPLVRSVVGGADAWLASGTRAKEYLVAMGAAPERVFCAYYAAESGYGREALALAPEARIERLRRLGVTTNKLVLYCGQLIERKGLGDLLPAFGRFVQHERDVTLLVVGSGPSEARFRALAASAGAADRVIFAGFVPREQLPGYYGLADLFALPSREEVWGMVVSEALACGTPALTTTAAGCAPDAIVPGENGYVVPPGDPGALYAALCQHLAAETDRAAMRRRVLELNARHTIADQGAAFVEAVQCAVGRRRV